MQLYCKVEGTLAIKVVNVVVPVCVVHWRVVRGSNMIWYLYCKFFSFCWVIFYYFVVDTVFSFVFAFLFFHHNITKEFLYTLQIQQETQVFSLCGGGGCMQYRNAECIVIGIRTKDLATREVE